jgi:hypothetical protein
MKFIFDRKLFLYLSLAFILMTVIGTISHEYGHYISAKILGHDARVNYGMTILENNPNQSISRKESFIITLGGPMQTILTGTLGMILLYIFRKSFNQIDKLSFPQWTAIFMSLFWLRQVCNMFTWILFYIINGKFGQRGDEIKLARYLELPDWSILSATALIGIMVLSIIVLKFIPIKIRATFIIAGLVGGVSGYILWLRLFGKVLMP